MTAAPPGWLPAAPSGSPGPDPEALIHEARRRQHRRWLVIAVVAALLAGGVAAVIAGSSGGGRARPPSDHGARAAPAHGRPAAAHSKPPLMTVSQTSFPQGNSLSLAVGFRAVWVAGCAAKT